MAKSEEKISKKRKSVGGEDVEESEVRLLALQPTLPCRFGLFLKLVCSRGQSGRSNMMGDRSAGSMLHARIES